MRRGRRGWSRAVGLFRRALPMPSRPLASCGSLRRWIWMLGSVLTGLNLGLSSQPAERVWARPSCGPFDSKLPAWGRCSTCPLAIGEAIDLAAAQIPASREVCSMIPVEVTPCHLCGTDPAASSARRRRASCSATSRSRSRLRIRFRGSVATHRATRRRV